MHAKVLWSSGLVLLLLWIAASSVDAQPKADKTKRDAKPKAKKKGKVSLFAVNRRLIVTEKELKEVKEELAETKQQLQDLQSQVQSLAAGSHAQPVSPAGGSTGSEAVRNKFSDLPPCPGVDGFYLAEATRSCYHLEPSSVLQNFTEASETCEKLHPKSHLVVVNNPQEHEYLKNKWYHERGISSISRFWINLQKVENRNLWKWVNSGRRLLYSNWIPTTAHNDDRFGCAAVYSNEAFYWGDVACWGPHMVTCEIEQ